MYVQKGTVHLQFVCFDQAINLYNFESILIKCLEILTYCAIINNYFDYTKHALLLAMQSYDNILLIFICFNLIYNLWRLLHKLYRTNLILSLSLKGWEVHCSWGSPEGVAVTKQTSPPFHGLFNQCWSGLSVFIMLFIGNPFLALWQHNCVSSTVGWHVIHCHVYKCIKSVDCFIPCFIVVYNKYDKNEKVIYL